MFIPGYYTFDPFDAPVYIVSVTPHGAYDVIVTEDAGTFEIAGGTFEIFATAA